MHTKTLPDGRKINVERLNELLKDAPIEFVPLREIDLQRRSARAGYSRERYRAADPNEAGIMNEKTFLIDGRHRYFRRLDSGLNLMPVRRASRAQLEACLIGNTDE